MTVPFFQEVQHPFDGLMAGEIHNLSIDEIIIAQNQVVLEGQVLGPLGIVADMTLVGASGSGNVGTSTIGSITGATNSQNGVYTIELQATSATGEFEVQKPDGTLDGVGKIGTAYAGSINFTITNGGTATIGDLWTVTVTRPFDEGGEQFKAWGPGATDGSQAANAIALQPAVTGSGQTQKIAALRRDAPFRASAVNFGASAFNATISTTTMAVLSMSPGSGPIVLGSTITTGATANTKITGLGTGTGGVGTYTIDTSQTVSTSTAMVAGPTAVQQAFAQQQLAAKGIILR